MKALQHSAAYNQRGMAKIGKAIATEVHGDNLAWLAKNIGSGHVAPIKYALALFESTGKLDHKTGQDFVWFRNAKKEILKAPIEGSKPSPQYALINSMQYNKTLREAVLAVVHGEDAIIAAQYLTGINKPVSIKPKSPALSLTDKLLAAMSANALTANEINALRTALALQTIEA
jgi:hypothetical protein